MNMLYNIKDIRSIRKKLGITQSQLASRSGVSQSLIAKIESDRIDPAYSNVQKIFLALNSLSKTREVTAKDIMAVNVIVCGKDELLKDVIKKMKQISQLPVLESGKVIGLVSERNIVEKIIECGESDIKTVNDVLEDAPPIISKDTGRDAIIEMLKFFSLIIVQEKGRMLGVITKSDIIRKMFK